MTVDSVFEWLVDGAPGAESAADVIQRLGNDLRSAGIPLDRLAAFVRTLHPTVRGRSFVWAVGEPVKISELDITRDVPGVAASPVGQIVATKQPLFAPKR